jgi:hypothetical protein
MKSQHALMKAYASLYWDATVLLAGFQIGVIGAILVFYSDLSLSYEVLSSIFLEPDWRLYLLLGILFLLVVGSIMRSLRPSRREALILSISALIIAGITAFIMIMGMSLAAGMLGEY